MPPAGKTVAEQWEALQVARKNLRHAAHVYAKCKKENKEQAAEELEKASILHAMMAAVWGQRAGCARPAGKEGEEWMKSLEPENLLAKERE